MTIQTRLDDSLFHDSDRLCPFLPPDAADGALRARLFASGEVADAFVRRRRDRTGRCTGWLMWWRGGPVRP